MKCEAASNSIKLDWFSMCTVSGSIVNASKETEEALTGRNTWRWNGTSKGLWLRLVVPDKHIYWYASHRRSHRICPVCHLTEKILYNALLVANPFPSIPRFHQVTMQTAHWSWASEGKNFPDFHRFCCFLIPEMSVIVFQNLHGYIWAWIRSLI